jgi:hypothetical protein
MLVPVVGTIIRYDFICNGAKGSCGTSGRLSNPQVLAGAFNDESQLAELVTSTSRAVQDMASCVGAWSYSNDFTQVTRCAEQSF